MKTSTDIKATQGLKAGMGLHFAMQGLHRSRASLRQLLDNRKAALAMGNTDLAGFLNSIITQERENLHHLAKVYRHLSTRPQPGTFEALCLLGLNFSRNSSGQYCIPEQA